jgi:hypothetical protein
MPKRTNFSVCVPQTGVTNSNRDTGLSLREMIYEYKYQILILFKCLLLQPKMLFFGSNCERLCMMQFSLISLIPNLIKSLQDCADPHLNFREAKLVKPTSLKTSERSSLLAYVGLPLEIFGSGALFGPYTPLQQLDTLADASTKSYCVGSTNSLLLAQKERYADVLVNLDESSVTVLNTNLTRPLALTIPDRRWIDAITQTVVDTWDPVNPNRPITLAYNGSEEFIRLQFEEYLIALLSAVKQHMFLTTRRDEARSALLDLENDPTAAFGTDWVKAWQNTESFRLFNKYTDSHIFDIVDSTHPCAGSLTIEDVQRRLANQVADLQLDVKLQSGKEALGKHLATGQKAIGSAWSAAWQEIERRRGGEPGEAPKSPKSPTQSKEKEPKDKEPGSASPTIKCKSIFL